MCAPNWILFQRCFDRMKSYRTLAMYRHFSNASRHAAFNETRHSIIYDLAPKDKTLYSVLVDRGVGTVADVKKLISAGRVAVGGEKILEATSVCRSDISFEIDNISYPPTPDLAVYHKPLNVHCTTDDPWKRDCLKELIPKWPLLHGMHPVVNIIASFHIHI